MTSMRVVREYLDHVLQQVLTTRIPILSSLLCPSAILKRKCCLVAAGTTSVVVLASSSPYTNQSSSHLQKLPAGRSSALSPFGSCRMMKAPKHQKPCLPQHDPCARRDEASRVHFHRPEAVPGRGTGNPPHTSCTQNTGRLCCQTLRARSERQGS